MAGASGSSNSARAWARALVELGGIEPPSVWRSRLVLRPFPCLWLTVATPPGGRTVESFLDRQGSFPPVSGLSHRPPLLLLPGCSGQAPRGLAARDVSLFATW